MENATKALLIAAAVLIAIVLVALGVNLLNAGDDTSGQAENVANAIGNTIDKTTDKVNDALNNLNVTALDDKAFKEHLEKNYANKNVTGNQVLELCRLIRKKYGSLHVSCSAPLHITCGGSGLTHYSTIEETVRKNINGNYKIQFNSASNGSYSVWVTEVK